MGNNDFFESTFGFSEGYSYDDTRSTLLDMSTFTNVSNTYYQREHCSIQIPIPSSGGTKVLDAGTFSFPTVQQLRDHVQDVLQDIHDQATDDDDDSGDVDEKSAVTPTITISNIVGEARSMHSSSDNNTTTNGAIFQAASQFNLLEMVSPNIVPEMGITRYENDHTQGPACAIACAAGTAYRNYMVPMDTDHDDFDCSDRSQATRTRGQTSDRQLNALVDIELYLMEYLELSRLPWRSQNGYIEIASSKMILQPIIDRLTSDRTLQHGFISRLRIGIQEDTQVTDDDNDEIMVVEHDDMITSTTTTLPIIKRRVTQTYNAAIPVGNSLLSPNHWKIIAQLILKATYEATLLVGVLKAIEVKKHHNQNQKTKNNNKKDTECPPPPPIFLTKVGGGVFDNDRSWIIDAIQYAANQVRQYGIDLDIRIVHYRSIERGYNKLEEVLIPPSSMVTATVATTSMTTDNSPESAPNDEL